MNSVRCLPIRICSAAIVLALVAASREVAMGQEAKNGAAAANEPQKLIVRVYPVEDLLFVSSDYPFRGSLPTTAPLDGASTGQGFIGRVQGDGMGAGGMGGMGGGMGGGGMFSIKEPPAAQQILRQFGGGGGGGGGAANPAGGVGGMGAFGREPTIAMKRARQKVDLISLIRTYVNGDWSPGSDDNDIQNRCQIFGTSLIVRHTAEGQENVSNLLSALRSSNPTARSVTVEATWLILDSHQRDTILSTAARPAASESKGIKTLDPKQFHQWARQATAFHGQLTCLNGQQVHIATGRRRVVSAGASPSVGVGATGYTPKVDVVNVGAVLQVTPSIAADRHTAYLDLQNAVTQWAEPARPIEVTSHSFAGSTDNHNVAGPLLQDTVTVDRVDLGTQEWSTTASVPLGVPVLIGSVTLTDANDKSSQPLTTERPDLALVVEVRAN